MGNAELQVRRQDSIITSDKSRVLLRPFNPGSTTRIKAILGRVKKLTEEEARSILSNVFKEFRNRHRDVEGAFDRRYSELKPYLPSRYVPSATMRLLMGAYLSCEYALEAAALFNPSIVPHPDQGGIPKGSLRFIMSLRATGEGHISSIEFRTGLINEDGNVEFDLHDRFVSSPNIRPNPQFDKDEFIIKIRDEQHLDSTTREIFSSLPKSFKRSEILASIAKVKKKYKKLSAARNDAMSHVQSLLALNYEITFPTNLALSERVIFPVSEFESNGIEDARFVRFVDDDGSVRYYATYTAYNGRQIMPLLLETDNFSDIRVRSLSGKAAKNKGMALFPRKIRGKYVMISRHDGEKLYLAYSENSYSWRKPGRLLSPTFPWEFTQIGNCGSPIETDKGWLLLTHGVGPVRKYCIGAILLDLDDPAEVIGQLEEPLIAPDESEREGYVPNVVYTCGAIAHSGRLIIPYAMSDYATRIASVSIQAVLAAMKHRT